MSNSKISEIQICSMACQINDKCYYVVMPQSTMKKVFNIAAELSENGKLNLIDAPEGTKFEMAS
jgi:hypothetical protein